LETTELHQFAILQPLVALALWTLLVFTLIPIRRIRAMRSGRVSPKEFRMGESDKVPEDVRLPNKNMLNLFQMPVLFYVVCIVLYITQLSDLWFVYLAWAFVACRVVHSVIHVSYNHISHRFMAFAVSNVVLLLVWLRLVWKMM